jgi:hypothetical protein
VTIYFYNRSDLGHYKEVGLSAGDIKAFGSGQIDREAFLSSVALSDRSVEDVAKISNYIQAAAARRERPVQVDFQNGKVDVATQIESWVSDRDVRYEALRLADKAIDASPQGMVKTITISFSDPANQAPTRQVTITPDKVADLDAQLASTLSPIAVTQVGREVINLSAGPGALQERRQKALDRIKALQKDGVNVKAFMDLFVTIEQQAPLNDPARIEADLGRLESSLNDMEANRKALKEKNSQTDKSSSADTGPKAPIVGPPYENRRCFGYDAVDTILILRNPDGYAEMLKRKVPGPFPEENNGFYHAMRFFAQTLRQNNKIAEAEKYDRIVQEIQRNHPRATIDASSHGPPIRPHN